MQTTTRPITTNTASLKQQFVLLPPHTVSPCCNAQLIGYTIRICRHCRRVCDSSDD